MANLLEDPEWIEGIYQLEMTDPVVGGAPNLATGEGMSNVQAQQLAKRTGFLKEVLEAGGLGAEVAPEIADFDAVTKSGLYHAPSAANAPEGSATLTLLHIQGAAADQATQWAARISTDKAWMRRKSAGTWGAWREIRHSGNTGSAAAADVQTSTIDATAGRLLVVGAAGWMIDGAAESAQLPPGNDLNALLTSGIWRYDSATTGRPGASAGAIIHYVRFLGTGVNRHWQVHYSNSTTIPSGMRYMLSDGSWSPWHHFFTSENLLGTVSQSGGIPTGAVIQRGSNANGEFVRFADGLQICVGSIASPGSNTASGSIWRSTTPATWTPPAAFFTGTGLIACTATPTLSTAWGRANFFGGNVEVIVFSGVQNTDSNPVMVMAVGRWY